MSTGKWAEKSLGWVHVQAGEKMKKGYCRITFIDLPVFCPTPLFSFVAPNLEVKGKKPSRFFSGSAVILLLLTGTVHIPKGIVMVTN